MPRPQYPDMFRTTVPLPDRSIRTCRDPRAHTYVRAWEPEPMSDELTERLDETWARMLNRDWGRPELNARYDTLISEASTRPELRGLFPFTSLTRLCLSRSSEHPFTDLPCIAFHRDGYLVQATWLPLDEPVPVLLDVTKDVRLAVDALVRHLPADRSAWVGPGPRPRRIAD